MTEDQFEDLFQQKLNLINDLVSNDTEFFNALHDGTISNHPNFSENEQHIMSQVKAMQLTNQLLIQELFKAIIVDE